MTQIKSIKGIAKDIELLVRDIKSIDGYKKLTALGGCVERLEYILNSSLDPNECAEIDVDKLVVVLTEAADIVNKKFIHKKEWTIIELLREQAEFVATSKDCLKWREDKGGEND